MIEIKELSFSYDAKTPLLEQIQLSAQGGDVVGLLGRNGAGKTTLINLMAGLLRPNQGQCNIFGRNVRAHHPATLADIFYLPETTNEGNDIGRNMSAKHYRQAHSPFYPRFDEDAFLHYRKTFAIDEKKSLTAFSMGERKMFFFAFGLATGARLLLLDEPTNGLDIIAKGYFRQFIADVVADQERMAIISTHQIRELEILIDPIVILDKGKILFQLTADHIADRLTVEITTETPPEAIYTQATTGGIAVLRARRENEIAQRIDLELLFNAALNNPADLSQSLK